MITVSQKVEELVNRSPYLREAMSSRLINLSELARQLKPQLESSLVKDVSDGAIFMALQRYASSLKPYYSTNPGEFLTNLGLRSELFELTVRNSPDLLQKLSRLGTSLQDQRAALFVFTQSLHETTIIASTSLREALHQALKAETVIGTIPNLTGITLQRSPGQIERTGVLQFPLRILAWEGISVIEIITTSNEMMLIVRDFEVDRAVASIRQALAAARQKPATPSA